MKRDLMAIAGLLLVVVLAHAPVLAQWWLWDDPQLLYAAMEFRLIDHFVSPAVWQRQSTANFVPMVMLATETDLALFGVAPRGFYAHHLIVFAAAMAVLYAYLRTFAGRIVACLAAAALAVSQPAFTVATLLMDRHYVEGLLLAAMAMLLFRRGHPYAAGVAYLLACLEKEVFVPLPLLVFVQDYFTVPLSPAGRGVRGEGAMRNGLVCIVVVIAYLTWRVWMLGSFGGYGGGEQAIARVVTEGWMILTGTRGLAAIGSLAFATLLFVLAVRRAPLQAVAIVIAAVIFALVPIAGLTSLDSRYFFVAAAVGLAIAAAGAARTPLRSLEVVVFAAFCIAVATGGIAHGMRLRRELAFWERDGLYLWNAPSKARPLFTGANGWYIEGVQWLRGAVKGDSAPAAIASIPGLVISGFAPHEVAFATPQDPVKVSETFAIVRSHYLPSMPLTARLSERGNVFSWSLGPAAPGDAFFLVTPIYELIWTRQREGWLRLPADVRVPTVAALERPGTLRVLRRSGERWTVSDELPFPANGETVTWSR